MRKLVRSISIALGAAAMLIAASAAADPFNPPKDLSCSADALDIGLLGLSIHPVTSNPAYSPCATDSAQLLAFVRPGLTAGVLFTQTQLNPGPNVGALSRARVANLGLNLNALLTTIGLPAITAGELESQAETICAGGTRDFVGSSSVTNLQIGSAVFNGTVPLDVPFFGATIHLNYILKNADGVLVRPFWLESILGDLILGESRSGRARVGDQC